MRWRRDGTSASPNMIDLRLSNLGRLQLASGTNYRNAYELRVNALREAWALAGVWAEAVRCLKIRRFDLGAFMEARAEGAKGIEALLARAGAEPLSGLIEDYLSSTRATDTAKMRRRLERFSTFLGESPTVADLTTQNVERFLSGLEDLRSRMLEDGSRPLAKGSTVNRYRAVIGSLAT